MDGSWIVTLTPENRRATRTKVEPNPNPGRWGSRERAAVVVVWAEHPHERDEVTVADLLVGAGEQFALAGDHDSALEAYTRAAGRPCRSWPRATRSRAGTPRTRPRKGPATPSPRTRC